MDAATFSIRSLNCKREIPPPRSGHSATPVRVTLNRNSGADHRTTGSYDNNEKLLVFGGTDSYKSFNDLHVLDVGRAEWTILQPLDKEGFFAARPEELPTPRALHVACATPEKFFILGGRDGHKL